MFGKFSLFVSYAVIVQLTRPEACAGEALKMTVYYETLCPDSQDLFIHQLEPNLEKFINFIEWTLIPYGVAETKRYNNGSVESITCEHKEPECLGNKIQACVLNKVQDRITQTRFCMCFMVNKGDDKAFEKCAQTYGIDHDMINACATSIEGLNLLAAYGDIQNNAQPKVTVIPTLVLNGKQLPKDQEGALCKVLCDHLTFKPEACNSCSS